MPYTRYSFLNVADMNSPNGHAKYIFTYTKRMISPVWHSVVEYFFSALMVFSPETVKCREGLSRYKNAMLLYESPKLNLVYHYPRISKHLCHPHLMKSYYNTSRPMIKIQGYDWDCKWFSTRKGSSLKMCFVCDML